MATAHILPVERFKFGFYTLCAFLLSPVVFAVSLLRKDKMVFERGRPKILIVPIMTRVGDLVCSTVAIRAAKVRYPEARVSVLVGKKIVSLMKVVPYVDEVVNINDLPFKGFWGRGRFFVFLFRQRFDAVVCLTNNPFNNLVAWFSASSIRIKTVVRRRSLAEMVTDILSNKKLLYETGTFLQDHYVKLLQFVGVPFSRPVKEVVPTAEGDRNVDVYLAERQIGKGHLVVGITPSAGHRAKEWPLERFAKLIESVIEKHDARVILIDAPSNDARVQGLISRVPELVRTKVFAATNFALSDIPSLIKRLNVFIAVDTGNIYIAHALKVPLVDITGPVHPDEQPPSDELSIQVRPPADMKPVFFVLEGPGNDAYEKAPALVNSITPEMVFSAFEELVRRTMSV